MADKPSYMQSIKDQLARELDDEVAALVADLRSEFDDGTVELVGQEATNYLQQSWVVGKGLRDVEEIDRLGPEKWWDQVFEHVATHSNSFAKEVFITAILANAEFTEALDLATVPGGLKPPASPEPAPMEPAGFASMPTYQGPPEPMPMPPPVQMPPAPEPLPPVGV